MYTAKNLSSYYIDTDINIVDANTGEIVLPELGQFKLQTDEIVNLPITKKSIKLVRRFTREQLAKLIETAIPVNVTSNTEPMLQEPNVTGIMLQDAEMLQDIGTDVTGCYKIEGNTYETLREASKAVGVSHMTLKRWVDAGKEGYTKL